MIHHLKIMWGQQHPKEFISYNCFLLIIIINIIITINLQLCYGQIESYYYLGCYDKQNESLKQVIPAKIPQACVELCEIEQFNYALMTLENCYCSNEILYENKQENALCTYHCNTTKLEFCGGPNLLSYYTTKWALDVSPKNLRLINATENMLSLSWDTKQQSYAAFHANAETPPIMKVKNYIIKANIMHTYSSLPLYTQPEFSFQSDQTTIELTDLHPATEYNVTVTALCEIENTQRLTQVNCGTAYLVATTIVGEPQPPPTTPIILDTSNNTITVQIQPIRNDNGPVSQVLIIVEYINDDIIIWQPFQENLLGNWQQSEEQGIPYYIAAELDYTNMANSNRTRTFVVGDGKRYGRYTNPPLHRNISNIRISLGVVSTLNGHTRTLFTHNYQLNESRSNANSNGNSGYDDEMLSTDNNFQYSIFDIGKKSRVALISTCIIFALCFFISLIIYIYLRYKTKQLRAQQNRSHLHSHEMTMQQPIISQENNGYLAEDELPTIEAFKEQLNNLLLNLKSNKRLPRNQLRMNVNDVVADGNYGEVITGKIITMKSNNDVDDLNCQLHILDLNDLTSVDQAKLLREFSNVLKMEQHSNILDFYGISASSNWFYVLFEHHNVTLKQRLLESRTVQQSSQASQQSQQPLQQRMTTLSEQLVLEWIYEVANAMEYLTKLKITRVCLCSHNIYVTADAKLKLSIFGPIPYVSCESKRKIDPTRWLAPEVLRYQSYTLKSEIWSFAIVAWECCTLGATPYTQFTNNQQLLDAIKNGCRPQQPSFVFNDIYQMLLNCWSWESNERPTYDDLCYTVRQLMTSPRHALCFDRQLDQILPFYMPLLEQQA